MKPGTVLNEHRVLALARLLSRSIPRLDPSNVLVTDLSTGRIYSVPEGTAVPGELTETTARPRDPRAEAPGVATPVIGTWFFDNPEGDDQQMSIFGDGRVVVLYSNGHRDETRLNDSTVLLAEYYDGLKATITPVGKDILLQTSEPARGLGKIWKRIDASRATDLLGADRPATDGESARRGNTTRICTARSSAFISFSMSRPNGFSRGSTQVFRND